MSRIWTRPARRLGNAAFRVSGRQIEAEHSRNRARRAVALAAGLTIAVAAASPALGAGVSSNRSKKLGKVNHIVVIYQENHSFDNLYGSWEGVNGLAQADPAHTIQVSQAGVPYDCLLQNDVKLTSPPLPATCTDNTTGSTFQSAFPNAPFAIDDYISPSDTSCPPPGAPSGPPGIPKGSGLPGGCTEDLVHRFYQEQYQLDGGRQDRYTTGSDAVGLTQGYYRTRNLPIYKYLHKPAHPRYAIADNFFQSAFGGSFLNHQWLIAAATPTFPNPPSAVRSVIDSNGMPAGLPTNANYALYTATGPVADRALTATCAQAAAVGRPELACGDYAVNTIQPTYQPFLPGTPLANRLPPQTAPTIGDELSAKGIDWAWYSGGWSNANGNVGGPGWTNGNGPTCSDPNAFATAVYPNCPDKLFQFHHQPFNYFLNFAPGTAARAAHLRDEEEFIAAASSSTQSECKLKPVSFVKPIGEENEHPGYASEAHGSSHLVDLLKAVENSGCRKDTMVIATYDEFGGQWDHVTPPGQGGVAGPHDIWGPGTRIPALVVSPFLLGQRAVDPTQYDTTSILATIEHRFGLAPLGSRDAAVADLSGVFRAHP
jgi:acid phosphatase